MNPGNTVWHHRTALRVNAPGTVAAAAMAGSGESPGPAATPPSGAADGSVVGVAVEGSVTDVERRRQGQPDQGGRQAADEPQDHLAPVRIVLGQIEDPRWRRRRRRRRPCAGACRGGRERPQRARRRPGRAARGARGSARLRTSPVPLLRGSVILANPGKPQDHPPLEEVGLVRHAADAVQDGRPHRVEDDLVAVWTAFARGEAPTGGQAAQCVAEPAAHPVDVVERDDPPIRRGDNQVARILRCPSDVRAVRVDRRADTPGRRAPCQALFPRGVRSRGTARPAAGTGRGR